MPMITPMTTPTITPIDTGLLTLAQWLGPGFPIGAFAFSHGLETAIASGWVHDGPSLHAWLGDLLHYGSGRSDAIWVWAAIAATDAGALAQLHAEARARMPAAERLREGDMQGAAFARLVRQVWGLDLPDMLLPLAVGRAVALSGLPQDQAVALYLQGFVANLVSAAVRLVPLGQTTGQQVQARLAPACAQIAAETRGLGPDDIYSNSFLADVAAMRHETQEPRLFQS